MNIILFIMSLVVVLVAALAALWIFGERGHLMLPSTRASIRVGGRKRKAGQAHREGQTLRSAPTHTHLHTHAPRRKPNVLDENSPTSDSQSYWEFYIRSKLFAERALMQQSQEGGPPLLVLRPGILYSAEGERLLRRCIPAENQRWFIGFGGCSSRIAPHAIAPQKVREYSSPAALSEGEFGSFRNAATCSCFCRQRFCR